MAAKRFTQDPNEERMTPELLQDIQNTCMKLCIWAECDRLSLMEHRRAKIVIGDLDFWEKSYPKKPPRASIVSTIGDVIALGDAAGKPTVFGTGK